MPLVALSAAAVPAEDTDGLRWTAEPSRLIWAPDGGLATLGGGRSVRLAGVEVPGVSPPSAAADVARARLAEAARAALAELLDGEEVQLGLAAGDGAAEADRYGRVVAHLRRAGDGLWIQGELLRGGLARVRTTPDQRALADEMLALEAEARAARRGIWADPAYAVRRHDAAAPLVGSFQLVDGRIVAAGTSGAYLYLNFGRDRRRDFTVRVRRDDVAAFRREGLDPEGLVGRRVRVRGWLLDAGGPLIELSHPEQIEVLE